jgi:hypothetical protein
MAAGKKYKQKDQQNGGKIEKPGPDNPAFSGSDSDEDKAFPDGKSIFNLKFLDAEAPKVTEDDDPEYAGPPDVSADSAKKLEDVRKKVAKNADKPTSAAGKIGEKDLTKIMKEVDPNGKGQVMPELYKKGQQIMNLLNMGSASGGGGGGGGGQQPQTTDISAGIKIVLNDSFTGALCILVKRFSFEVVVTVFLRALENGLINNVNPRYRTIVQNGVSNLIRLALYFGPLNIPVSQYDNTVYGDVVPDKVVDQKDVPDFYERQYYTLSDDPYPGYIEWRSKDETDRVWVKSDPRDLVFTSSDEEVYSISERELADDFNVYMVRVEYNGKLIFNTILGPYEINNIFARQENNIQVNTLNLNMGNNAGGQPQNSQGGGGGGGADMIGQLAGLLQQLISQFKDDQLPKSVLDQGNMNKVMEDFKKDMGINNQIFELGKKALGGGSPMDALGNLGGLQGIMGGFMSGGGGMSGAAGGLMGSGGSLGGGSGGGGGGAGSGFGGAPGAGEYEGGGISESGLKDIEDMLKLLGVK